MVVSTAAAPELGPDDHLTDLCRQDGAEVDDLLGIVDASVTSTEFPYFPAETAWQFDAGAGQVVPLDVAGVECQVEGLTE